MNRLWLLALCSAGTAGATNIDFGVTYPLTARVGVSDVSLLSGRLAAGLSTQGADLTFSRLLSLPPLGAVSVNSSVQVAWTGGVRLGSAATGAAGPLALNLAGTYFTTAASTFDPLAAWTPEPTDLRAQGWRADLSLRYRVNRQTVAVLGTELGGQWNVYGGAELRRDLTRTLPPAEGDDPEAPPETEKIGSLSYRVGVRAGRNVLGATAGITYATETGRTFALDAQLGPNAAAAYSLGLVASASFPDVLGEGSTLRPYLAYEPWRPYVNPLRAGVEATRPLGPGTLKVDVRGGQSQAGLFGFGVGVAYSFPLDRQAEQP